MGVQLITLAAGVLFVMLGAACAVGPDRPPPTVAAIGDTATVAPTPDRRPARCRGGEAALETRLAHLERSILEAMAGYRGTWSMALVDLDCEAELSVRPEYVEYPASAGKIVILIAVLRAVQDGRIDLREVEQELTNVTTHSLDADANVLNGLVSPAEIQAVLERSRVSERTRFQHDWRQAVMPALDLARVWAALLRGELLGSDRTEYLLGLVTRAQIPAAYETFPAAPDVPGYEFGQKAGYFIDEFSTEGYVLVGAGFLRPHDRSHRGVAAVLMIRTTNPDLEDPQRRSVFALVTKYVQGVR